MHLHRSPKELSCIRTRPREVFQACARPRSPLEEFVHMSPGEVHRPFANLPEGEFS